MDRPTYLRKRRPAPDESEGIVWRLVAALVAIPIFEVSLFLGTYLVLPSRDMAYLLMAIPLWVHAVYAGTAAAVGLVFGFKGITWLLGHLFMTHREEEKNLLVTRLLWAGFIGLALAASFFVE